MTWVKICGITNLEDALVAVEAGADALGFVFYEKSPRHVAAEKVRDIVFQLPPKLEIVGVFPGRTLNEIADILRTTGITSMQIYAGTHAPVSSRNETAESPNFRGIRTYLALAVSDCKNPKVESDNVRSGQHGYSKEGCGIAAVLLDSGTSWQPGGTGRVFKWSDFISLSESLREWTNVIVAGGLHAENVAEAITTFRPWGVDVSSGVEAKPGKKDPEKVRAFIRAVRGVDKKISN
jgi:phosphoribosylanthranilate isomerase